jgi:hypothetical protein
MTILIALIVWFIVARLIIGRFRDWVEGEPYVIDSVPLPLWLYLVFFMIAFIPSGFILWLS